MSALLRIPSIGEFPVGSVVRTWALSLTRPDSISGQGTKIPQASWCDQKKKKKESVWLIYGKGGLKEMATTPVFLPGKSHGQEPGGLQSMGSQESDMT